MHTTRSGPAIRATGPRKSFGEQLVLDGIDLEVPAGTVFALLGPNGAGKTTTVRIPGGHIRSSSPPRPGWRRPPASSRRWCATL